MPGVCPRCQKNVFFAEERRALGNSWHKMCFKCAECNKLLDSTNVTQREESELFCKTCYGRNFGPKGYGFGGGSAGVLSMDDGTQYKNGPPTSDVSHLAQAYVAPKLAVRPASSGLKSRFGGAETCSRCGKPVYIAEKMLGGGGVYHKTCFCCTGCQKRLESSTLTEHEGQIYCKSCYGRNFGPKGYGYGIGAGTLQTEAM